MNHIHTPFFKCFVTFPLQKVLYCRRNGRRLQDYEHIEIPSNVQTIRDLITLLRGEFNVNANLAIYFDGSWLPLDMAVDVLRISPVDVFVVPADDEIVEDTVPFSDIQDETTMSVHNDMSGLSGGSSSDVELNKTTCSGQSSDYSTISTTEETSGIDMESSLPVNATLETTVNLQSLSSVFKTPKAKRNVTKDESHQFKPSSPKKRKFDTRTPKEFRPLRSSTEISHGVWLRFNETGLDDMVEPQDYMAVGSVTENSFYAIDANEERLMSGMGYRDYVRSFNLAELENIQILEASMSSGEDSVNSFN